MSPMYERIDRGVWLTIPGDRTFFNLLLTSSPAINGYAEYEGNNLLLVSVRVKYMIYLFGMGRIWTVQKIFTVQKKCHTHLVSFITHHGLFVLYIVEIFNCKKCHIHMVPSYRLPNITWERTHAITLNTTLVPPWKIFYYYLIPTYE